MTKSKNPLRELSEAMVNAVTAASKYTVSVDGRRRLPATGVGLGPDLVLTADHVLERDEDVKVTLPSGESFIGAVAGRDPGSDLAVLRLEEAAIETAVLVDKPAQVGQLVLALGRPTSGDVQASLGVVSAIGGPVRTRRGGMLRRHLRTDAIPYPGFSGGPLVDADGYVVGINTSGLGIGASLVIPADEAWQIGTTLVEKGSVKQGFLGIRSQPVELAADANKALKRDQNHGLLITKVERETPAMQAGLLIGDILVGIAESMIEDPQDLLAHLSGDLVGKPVVVELLRGGKPKKIEVVVSERPEPKGYRRRGHRTMRRAHHRHQRSRDMWHVHKHSKDMHKWHPHNEDGTHWIEGNDPHDGEE